MSKKLLSQRSATLLPLARGPLIDNDMARMKSSVAELASEKLDSYMDRDGTGLSGVGRRVIDSAVGGATSKIAEVVVGDHATEKVLTTMVKQHGMVDNPEFDMSDNAEYRLAAGVAAAYLLGEKDYDKPLHEYAPIIRRAQWYRGSRHLGQYARSGRDLQL